MNSKRLFFLLAIAGVIFLAQAHLSTAAPDRIDGPTEVGTWLQEGTLEVSHGPISGEVTDTSAVLWARGSVPGALRFEEAADAAFDEVTQEALLEVTEASDLTGEVLIEGLSPGQPYYYRVVLEADGQSSEPVEGEFSTAPAADTEAAFDFVFSVCLGGQGYCRDPETGWVIFDAMLAQTPDFFILTGDSIYEESVINYQDRS